MGIALAGATAVGKTTLARRMARENGLRLVEIDTRRCMKISLPLARQICFVHTIAAYTLKPCDDCIYDNSLLTVYAYTQILAEMKHAAAFEELLSLVKRLALIEMSLHRVILVKPRRGEHSKRIRMKALLGGYEGDPLWWRIDHEQAQSILEEIAKSWQIETVET